MASTFDLMMQDAGPAQAGSVFGQMRADAGSPALPPLTADPAEGMSTLDRLRAGVGKAFADIGRGVGQYVPTIQNGHLQPLVSRQDVADANKLDAPLMATGAGTAGNIAGNVALAAPAALIPGANTVAGASAIGAAYGALQPSTSTSQSLSNVGMGAAGSALVPGAILAARAGRSLVEPLYQSGRNQIVGRALSDAAGGDAQALAQALRGNASAVPGVQYTAAEAAGNPSVAALQRTASQINPVVMNEANARQVANNAARVNALNDVAGAGGARDFFGAARDATADQMYATARANGLHPLTQQQQTIVGGLMQRPAMRDALATAQRLAQNEGLNLADPAGSVAGLDYVRRALADQVATSAGNERRILQGLQTQLTGVMDQLSPDLRAARETFAGMSRPLNQMDVAQTIADRSIKPLTGNLQPNAYARALSDQTAAHVTGMPNATLANTMEPQALRTLNAIRDDLQRQDFAASAGRPVGSDTVQKLAYSNMMGQVGLPNAVRNFGPAGVVGSILERGGQVLYSDANRRLSEQLARALLNPHDAAALIEGAQVTPQMARLANALRRGGAALGASTPALIQSGQ